MSASVRLFSYGTLQQRAVQLANYGRELQGEPDRLVAHMLAPVAISRVDVVEISGKAIHTIARRTGNPADAVAGTVYLLTPAELDSADAYEDPAYTRVEVVLESGRTAFAYVAA